jgi:hypothetical protein
MSEKQVHVNPFQLKGDNPAGNMGKIVLIHGRYLAIPRVIMALKYQHLKEWYYIPAASIDYF